MSDSEEDEFILYGQIGGPPKDARLEQKLDPLVSCWGSAVCSEVLILTVSTFLAEHEEARRAARVMWSIFATIMVLRCLLVVLGSRKCMKPGDVQKATHILRIIPFGFYSVIVGYMFVANHS
mmetsp:Transcript_158686/g.280290  ORF Transcript_158686/g.280290 Transcript_158686/m.280290 type:complete len:122 (+) Transcript_158686:78-443(+)